MTILPGLAGSVHHRLFYLSLGNLLMVILQRRELDFIIGGGGVTHCDSTGSCDAITPPRTFKMPNGLAKGAGNLVYVPDTIAGTISVYSIDRSSNSPANFTLIEKLAIGMPLDNIAIDLNGDLWVPGFPDGFQLLKWMEDPPNARLPATVWKIKTAENGEFEVKKIVEDAEARVLNAVTVVRHDVATGRLFMGGKSSPVLIPNWARCVLTFLGAFNEFFVCEPKK